MDERARPILELLPGKTKLVQICQALRVSPKAYGPSKHKLPQGRLKNMGFKVGACSLMKGREASHQKKCLDKKAKAQRTYPNVL